MGRCHLAGGADAGSGRGRHRSSPAEACIDVRNVQATMSHEESSSTVDRESQPQPTTCREVKSVCQSSFGRCVGCWNVFPADSRLKAGLGIKS